MNKQEIFEKLRPYQKEAVEFLRNKPRAMLCDDMGVGKTLSILATIESLMEKEKHYKILILCPKFALYVWQNEIKKWFNKNALIYSAPPAKRQKIWEEFLKSHQYDYFITTYGMLEELSYLTPYDNFWDCVIADEIHIGGLLNHKTKTYQLFEKFTRNIKKVYLLTGTPIRQGVIDLYAPLHIVNRYLFKNYWQYVNKYCITIDTPFGKEIERRPRNVEEFRRMLSNYMIRRTKEEVINELPGKQRQLIFVEMTPKQIKAYDDLVKDAFTVTDQDIVLTPNVMTTILRLRQLLVCPRLLGIDDDGGALQQLVEMGKDLIESGKPFVVFTPFRQAIQYIEKAIMDKIKVRCFYIYGGMTAEQFASQWQGFQNYKDHRKVLLCVIKSGASFQATAAAHAFFLGYEWDFNLNVQSEDRLCRLGQKDFVNIYYMMHKDTVDEDVAQKLNDKQDASNWIIGNQEQYEALLRRYKIIKD